MEALGKNGDTGVSDEVVHADSEISAIEPENPMKLKSTIFLLAAAACVGAGSAQILLSTNFQDRALDGPSRTASGFSWTSDLGQAANASTSLTFTGSATGFIGGYGLNSGSLNPPGQPVPVAGNVETGGPWSTDFTFTPDISVDLTTVRMISYAISGGGAHQLNPKSVAWAVNITGGAVNETVTAGGTDPAGNAPLILDLDFTGVALEAGTPYTFTLTVSSPAPTGGNNIALNSIEVNATPAPGDALTWVGADGGGTWDLGTTAHWKDSADEPATYQNFGIVTFDDTAASGIVSLAEPGIEPFSVTFANATLPFTLSGESWSGAATLTKTGAAEVTLLIDNNLASTTISGGTLRIGDGGTDGSLGSGPIVNDGNLVIARDGMLEVDAEISGSGTLGIEGPGTAVLTGNVTHTGATTISGGTLRAAGALDSPVTIGNGATLAPGPVATSGVLDLPGLNLQVGSRSLFRANFTESDQIAVTTPGGLAINGSHSIDLIPTDVWLPGDEFTLFTYDSSFTGSVANLQIGDAPHGSYTIFDDSPFGEIVVRIDSIDTLVWKGNSDSNWDLDETVNWQLLSDSSAAPFYAYDQVRFDNTATLTTVTLTDAIPVGDMTFDFDAPTGYLLGGPGTLTGFGLLDKEGTGTLTIATTLANTGGIRIVDGTLAVGDGGTTGSIGSGTVINEGSLVFDREDDIAVANAISGAGTLTQQGTGTLTLGGAATNTFTGDATVAGGRLTLAKPTALGASVDGAKTVTVADGAQLNFNNYTTAMAANRSYTFRIAGDGDGTGALVNNSGGGIASNAGVLNLELTGDATIGGTARYDLGFASGTQGVITGNGHTLTKIGPNQIMLRGDGGASEISIIVNQGILGAENSDNSLGGATGSVTVNDEAVLAVFGALNIPTPVTLNSGAILRALGGGAATWSGNFTLGGIATVNTPSADKTLAGTISGSGGLNKTGGNTLTLTAFNDYTGPTTVSAGTLSIGHPYLNDTAAVAVGINGTLNLDFTGTDLIGSLTIAGNTLAPGIYDAGTHPGLLSGTGALEVVSSASDYGDWADSFGLVGGPDDDDDGDGLTNFQKYAFGLDPTDPSDINAISPPDRAAGTFTYTRRTLSLTGLNYVYESSSDLVTWDSFTPASEASDDGTPVETITVTIPPALLSEDKLFLRIEASEP